MEFPQYRKLAGFARYYRIENERMFIEAYIQNGKIIRTTIQAVQFPEILRIKDMLEYEFNYADMTEQEQIEFFHED